MVMIDGGCELPEHFTGKMWAGLIGEYNIKVAPEERRIELLNFNGKEISKKIANSIFAGGYQNSEETVSDDKRDCHYTEKSGILEYLKRAMHGRGGVKEIKTSILDKGILQIKVLSQDIADYNKIRDILTGTEKGLGSDYITCKKVGDGKSNLVYEIRLPFMDEAVINAEN